MTHLKLSFLAFMLFSAFTFAGTKITFATNMDTIVPDPFQKNKSNSDKLSDFAAYVKNANLLGAKITVDLNKSFVQVVDGAEVLFLAVKNDTDGGLIKGIKTSVR